MGNSGPGLPRRLLTGRVQIGPSPEYRPAGYRDKEGEVIDEVFKSGCPSQFALD